MLRSASVGVIIFLLFSLVGLSTSLCREIMLDHQPMRVAATCHDDACCNVCLVDQDESPGLLQKTSGESTAHPPTLLSDAFSDSTPRAERTGRFTPPLVNNSIGGGEVYLLNSAFLI